MTTYRKDDIVEKRKFRAGNRQTAEDTGDKIFQVVDCDKLNMREGPFKDSPVLMVLDKGRQLNYNPSGTAPDGWTSVECRDGAKAISGYCMSKFLKEVPIGRDDSRND